MYFYFKNILPGPFTSGYRPAKPILRYQIFEWVKGPEIKVCVCAQSVSGGRVRKTAAQLALLLLKKLKMSEGFCQSA